MRLIEGRQHFGQLTAPNPYPVRQFKPALYFGAVSLDTLKADTVKFSGVLSSQRKSQLNQFCTQLGIPIPADNKAYNLIDKALTPPGAVDKRIDSNQRLELLGDSVLATITIQYLMSRFNSKNEGAISQLSHLLTCNVALGVMGRRMGLQNVMKLPGGFEKMPQKGRNTTLADTVEAFIGALYLANNNNTQMAYKAITPFLRTMLKEVPEKLHTARNYDIAQISRQLWGN